MTPGPVARSLPTTRAMLWRPESAGSPLPVRAAGLAIFVEQRALTALQEHATASSGQGLLGFLVGDLCRDPDSGVLYVVVDATIRLNQALVGDKTGVVMGKLWDRIQAEIANIHGHLIGWYHSHPPLGVGLSPADVETHLKYFTESWQVALVLAAESRGATAGFFRPGREPGSVTAELAFYELMPEGAAATASSVLPWVNFRTEAEVAKTAPPPQPQVPKLRLPKYTPRPTPKPSRGLDPRDLDELLGTTALPKQGAPPPPPRRTSGPSPRPQPPAPAEPPALEIERASDPPPPPPRRESAPPPRPKAIEDLPLLDVEEPADAEPPPPVPRRVSAPVPPPPPLPPPSPPRPARMSAETRTAPAEIPVPAETAAPARRPVWQLVAVGALVLGALGAGAWFSGILRRAPEPAPAPPPATQTPAARPAVDPRLVALDRLGDTLARTVRAYGDRARLFDDRRMTCADLARGLVAVEQRWIAYNADGKAPAPPLDAERARRDERLYAAVVDSVDRHFERSGCARP